MVTGNYKKIYCEDFFADIEFDLLAIVNNALLVAHVQIIFRKAEHTRQSPEQFAIGDRFAERRDGGRIDGEIGLAPGANSKVEDSDVEFGRHLAEALEPFLLDLIWQGLADKTLARHRDYLEMLGGEIIRRRHDDQDLTKQPVGDLLSTLIEEDGGPLIWPRVTETTQRELDATCRKL